MYEIAFSVKGRPIAMVEGRVVAWERCAVFDARLLVVAGDPTIDVYFVPSSDNPGWFSLDPYPPHRSGGVERLRLEAFEALRYIREAVVEVLTPRGLGAICEISGMAIHPVDFSEWKFRGLMARRLEYELSELGL